MQNWRRQAIADYEVRLNGNSTASRLVVILGAWSVFWVVCSDYILSLFIETPPVLWSVEWVEGAIYVSVSGVIAGVLVRRIQRENERARRANESKLRSLQAAGLIGIFTWRNGSIVDANDTFLDMLAYTKDDLAAGRLTIAELTAPEYHPLEAQARRELDEEGRSRIFQAELIGKNGTRVVVVGGRARIEGADHYGIGYALDITPLVTAQKEQKQLEEQLQRADRLNALGRLAGGIAHDFNNLLGVIVGYAAMVKNNAPGSREHVEQVLKAADKAKDLIRKLLTFSQKRALHPELLDVNATIEELQKMLSRLVGDTIELRLELADNAGCVLADRTEIEQVVMNLVVNARDAMQHGGAITIATEKVCVEPGGVRQDVAPGNYVSIRVRDNGEGIDAAVLDHIFEPFFSTKLESGGTGLGLAIVYGVVKQHGGHIRVESQPHRGTEVTLLFPWSAASTCEPAPAPAPRIERGTETILLMEDSEEMRWMLATVLRSLGYTVLTAEDGQRGIEVASDYGKEIHLILADLAMPRLSGPDAAAQIRHERPTVKVVLLTGFADSKLLEGKSLGDVSILEKPIAPEVLASRIREILGSGPSSSV
jgi:PAS domain S-box-containing protein